MYTITIESDTGHRQVVECVSYVSVFVTPDFDVTMDVQVGVLSMEQVGELNSLLIRSGIRLSGIVPEDDVDIRAVEVAGLLNKAEDAMVRGPAGPSWEADGE